MKINICENKYKCVVTKTLKYEKVIFILYWNCDYFYLKTETTTAKTKFRKRLKLKQPKSPDWLKYAYSHWYFLLK